MRYVRREVTLRTRLGGPRSCARRELVLKIRTVKRTVAIRVSFRTFKWGDINVIAFISWESALYLKDKFGLQDILEEYGPLEPCLQLNLW